MFYGRKAWSHSDNFMRVFEVRVLILNTTFTNISVMSRRTVLLVEETGVPGENHRPTASQ